MLPRRTGRRRINEALAVVSPLAFADAVEAYVTTLQSNELRALVMRSIKRMDSSERMQFALFLGHDAVSGRAEEIFARPTMKVDEVQRLVEACPDFLPNRFAAFLRENPRAVPSLGDEAVTNVLATLPLAQDEPRTLPTEERTHRARVQAALVLGLAVLIALVPLAAQYIRQRGMIAENVNPPSAPVLPLLHSAAGRPKVAQTLQHRPAAKHTPARIAPKHAVALAPVRARTRTHSRAIAKRNTHRAVHVASTWKFDPRYNPYFNRSHFAKSPPVARSGSPARSAHVAVAQATSLNAFETRARMVVSSYLGAVIAGDTPRALQHLGLPRDGDPKAISESSIISRGTRAEIVAVKPGDDGTTHVQVDILGRRGEYFEVFSVTPDGPAVRIKDRFYIPVNRTAEEISARLLARTPH